MKTIEFQLNGEKVVYELRGDETLLELLREKAGYTGSKAGCKNGDCGACTLHLDGLPVKSCLIFAIEVEGREVRSVEGLGHLLQEAFMEEQGYQCGFCTSGFLMNAAALLEAHPEEDPEIDREWLDSNLCRCTGYEGIKRSIALARERMKASQSLK